MRDWSVPDLNSISVPSPIGSSDSGADWDIQYKALLRGGLYYLSFGDSVIFRACFQTKVIELVSASMDDPVTLDHLLYDHVIPRVLSACGTLVLHGSLVRIGEGLAVFMGETGAGKSTLGASLHALGHRLLGDDAVIVTENSGTFYAEAVYPSLRLYPDSISRVLAADVATAPMARYSDKRHVTEFRQTSAGPQPLPLTAIFALHRGDSNPQVRHLSARESCMAMIEQSFALDPNDVDAARERMNAAASLASAVPGFELAIPHDYDRLPQVHALIEDCMIRADGKSSAAARDGGHLQ